MKDYFKTTFSISNLPGEADYFKKIDYNKEYFQHSYLSAREKFQKDSELISSGKLTDNLESLDRSKIYIDAKLIYVIVHEDVEKKFIIQTSKDSAPILRLHERALAEDKRRIIEELEMGCVRHQNPISEEWSYRIETRKTTPEIDEELEIQNIGIADYGTFERTAYYMSWLHYSDKDRCAAETDPELGQYLTICNYLIHRTDSGESKILLADYRNSFLFPPALEVEIRDKYYMEQRAARNRKGEVIFGYSADVV